MHQFQKTLFIILLCSITFVNAQRVRDFFYVAPQTKNLPVFVRGNIDSKKMLFYVQGGGADNGIDFGRSDYPKWKKTLEQKLAIAYFDQRGLNRSVKRIDTTKINQQQVLQDIISIAKALQEKYQADIYLLGHSSGGKDVLNCLATFPEETAFIKAAIVCNAPITSDFSPERYNHYRPLYLKNLAQEFINKKENTPLWQEAFDWITQTDSISTPEASKKWNAYVDMAFEPTKRKIGLGMVLKVIFARPYNPIKYLNQKDNKFVADRLWYAEKVRWESQTHVPLWEKLPNIQHPILLLTGRYDPIATSEELKSAQKLIPNAELAILPNCHHESFLDQPQLFNTTILKFLSMH
ncbi:MAG: alpha/beta hydrolase [Bacteroidota bacterium]